MDGEGPYSVINEVVHVLCAPNFRVCIACVARLTDRLVSTERIQCSVARTLLNAAWGTPEEEILRRLTLPSLRWRREILSMALFFELLQKSPAPLCDCLFTFAKSKTNRSLRKPYQILLPYARSTRCTKSFSYRIHFSGTHCHVQSSH